VAVDRYNTPRKNILDYHEPNRPYTNEELLEMGIIAPERYDCETFVTGKAYREWMDEYARR
jgi:hypothetical protein